MTDRYCIVIPHYRHHAPLIAMLPTLVEVGLDVFIVDDASGADVTEQVEAAIHALPTVSLIQRSNNGGKGAAVMTGLRSAAARGFSHAISLDADGQHDPADVPRIHALSLNHPESLFTGRPVFGEDIPTSRLYGRMLTNTLVQLVTGSNMVKDAMCGLRVYPMKHVLQLCDTLGYRTRMEFDVEILVRACWAGLEVRSMDTKVIYPQDGQSHFNLFADNARLVAMHILLIIGGILRLPPRLWRRLTSQKAAID